MAFGAGKNGKVYINGYDLTAAFTGMKTEMSQGTYDATTFGATSKAKILGLADGSIALDGFFEAGTGSVDAVLQAALGAASDGLALVFPAGDAIGARGRGCAAIEMSYDTTSPVDGIVGIAASIEADGGIDGVVSLHALGAETATGAAASVDNAAASTNGGVAYIEATAFSGTSVTVKVQHSTDDSTWVDLVTFTAISAAHATERKTVAGTVNRYLRANHASGTFSSVTDVIAFARS